MATCGNGDRSLVLGKKKLWSNVAVRNKMSLVHTMSNNIPNDIIVEILLRLPAKSLLRLRWACKYWFDLISRDSSFVKMHLHRSTAHDEIFGIISPLLSICYGNGDRYEIFQCYLNYNNTTRVGDVSREVSIASPFKYPLDHTPRIVGFCNGLILFSKILIDKLCIWNPCTKEYIDLPHPLNIEGVFVDDDVMCNYGFGYDNSTDDHKVIRDTYFYGSKYPDLGSDVQAYSLGTSSWRRIEPNPYRFWHYQQEGVYADGALYWIDCYNKELISFDIGKEKFQHVSKIPNLSDYGDWWYNVRILVFEGSLCVVLKFRDQESYCGEMWVMKDYAVNNDNKPVWTKISTIPNLHDCFPIKPIRFTRDGQILMVTRQEDLLLHDLKKGSVETLYRISQDANHFIQEVYTESLVSLNSGTYTGQERRIDQTKNNHNK